jgi:putative PIN family toxin of toxin-antitoxin system
MPKRRRKIILDTNIWISFLISRKFKKLDNVLFNPDIQLVFSEELIEEFLTVLTRPKLRPFIKPADVKIILDFILNNGLIVKVISDVKICRDPKDNFLLSLAIDSDADYLVTGDHDLLSLASVEKTQIITLAMLQSVFT